MSSNISHTPLRCPPPDFDDAVDVIYSGLTIPSRWYVNQPLARGKTQNIYAQPRRRVGPGLVAAIMPTIAIIIQ
jgi:hypothetical protein